MHIGGSTRLSAVLLSTRTHSILGAMVPKENFRNASLARKDGRLASNNGCMVKGSHVAFEMYY